MRDDPLFRFTLILTAGFLFFGALYFAKNILIPLSFAALLSMLMLPVCKKLESWNFPRWLSVLLCLLIVFVVIAGLIYTFTTQMIIFADDLPKYKEAVNSKIETIQYFLEQRINVSPEAQMSYVKDKMNHLLESGGKHLQAVFLATTSTIVSVSVVIIYTFFFLYFRDRFRIFILKITSQERRKRTQAIIEQSSKVTAKYLLGVFIVIIILAILNSIGLMIIGLEYAIFFGSMAAILNIIPYIGVPIGAVLPVTMAFITRDSFSAVIGVIAVFAINQFIENNFLTPNIVGDKIDLNPLATIIILFIGASIWGIAGMVIFLPFLGIMKITMDHVESLQPYAYLIGTNEKSGPSKLMRTIKITWKFIKSTAIRVKRFFS